MAIRKINKDIPTGRIAQTSQSSSTRTPNTTIKKVQITDAITLINLLNEFAKFSGIEGLNKTKAQQLIKDGFGKSPAFDGYLLFYMNKPAGLVITQQFYSTIDAGKGLYLEAIYIKPEYRSKNLGKFLFKYIA